MLDELWVVSKGHPGLVLHSLGPHQEDSPPKSLAAVTLSTPKGGPSTVLSAHRIRFDRVGTVLSLAKDAGLDPCESGSSELLILCGCTSLPSERMGQIQTWEVLIPGDFLEEVAFETGLRTGLVSEGLAPRLGGTSPPGDGGCSSFPPLLQNSFVKVTTAVNQRSALQLHPLADHFFHLDFCHLVSRASPSVGSSLTSRGLFFGHPCQFLL